MNRMLLVIAAAALLLTSCAATMRLQATMPTQDMVGGTCAAPTLIPTVGGLVRAIITWSGPAAGRDSVIQAPGTAWTYQKSGLPSGLYDISVVCADSLGNQSCGVAIQKLLRSAFSDVTNLR